MFLNPFYAAHMLKMTHAHPFVHMVEYSYVSSTHVYHVVYKRSFFPIQHPVSNHQQHFKMNLYSLIVILFLTLAHCSNVHEQFKTAIENKDYSKVEKYLGSQHNMDPNTEFESTGNTPLTIAAQKRHLGIARLLILFEADKTLRDGSGKMPVHYAVTDFADTSFELVEALLPDRFDYDKESNKGKGDSFAALAKKYRHTEVLYKIRAKYPKGKIM